MQSCNITSSCINNARKLYYSQLPRLCVGGVSIKSSTLLDYISAGMNIQLFDIFNVGRHLNVVLSIPIFVSYRTSREASKGRLLYYVTPLPGLL